VNGIIHISEDRIAKVLYKNTVELSMLMNILAATAEVDEETLKKLRKSVPRKSMEQEDRFNLKMPTDIKKDEE